MTQKIKYISIKNYKGIQDIETNIPSRFVAIFWKNGAWKTSFLDAIKSAIKLEKWGNDKVRIWEEQWEIIVEFDDFTITRIVWSKGKLEVEHNWELVKKPQSWLDEIFMWSIGDPHKFLSLHNREKVSYLLSTHGKQVAFDELEKERSLLFSQRQDKHRTYLSKKEEIEKTDISSFVNVDTTDLQSELAEKKKQLSEIISSNESRRLLEQRIENWKALIKEKEIALEKDKDQLLLLEQQIANLIKQRNETQEKIGLFEEEMVKYAAWVNNIVKELESMDETPTSEIESQINDINNELMRASWAQARKEIYDEQVKVKEVVQKEWKELDSKVKEIQDEQNRLIEWIKLSYELKIEDGVMYAFDDGMWIPIDELNKAKQLEIGIDVCLSWPNKVKIITIEDANSLDPNTLEKIKQKIEKEEAQCFIETVYNTGHESIVIEDWNIIK